MSPIVTLTLTCAEVAEVSAALTRKRPFDSYEAGWRAAALRVVATHQPDRPLHIELHLVDYLSRVIGEANRGGHWEHLETALVKVNAARWPHVYPQAVPA